MSRDGERLGLSWSDRVQWIVDHYADGNRRALGRRVGLTGQAISAWVRGETTPSGEGLAALVEACPDLRARWLLTGRGAPRIAPEDDGAARDSRVDGHRARPVDAGEEPDEAALVERAYEAGRLDAVEEMIARLRETTAASGREHVPRRGPPEAAE